jgi:adenylosuccinate lyase
MASENLLMAAVQAGGDRQELHEVIRRHSQEAAQVVKQEGRPNDLLARLASDPAFQNVNVAEALDPLQYVGRAPEQVDTFLAEVVAPIERHYAGQATTAEVRV